MADALTQSEREPSRPQHSRGWIRQQPVGALFKPLHELPSVCCSSGGCRAMPSWPMNTAQEGWLELDGVQQEAAQVALVSFNGRGFGVVLRAGYPVHQGMHGMLTTPMHGGGCNHRPVFCCWQRPHPQDRQLQCVGLRFDFGDERSP
jgi:hypothetical protein